MIRQRILSIDGGGCRGLVAVELIRGLEALLAGPILSHLELLAGSSVGAIIACGLAAGFSSDQVLADLARLAPRIFRRGPFHWLGQRVRYGLSAPAYRARDLEGALRDVFGDRRFGDLERPTIVPVVDAVTGEVYVLRSDHGLDGVLPVWEVCTASASAPTYFSPHELVHAGRPRVWVDGGVAANDPSVLAILEVLARGIPVAEIRCVAVGTGRPVPSRTAAELAGRGALEWAHDVAELFLVASTSTAERVARELLPRDAYHRIQTLLPPALMPMDDARPERLRRLQAEGALSAHQLHGRIRVAAAALTP